MTDEAKTVDVLIVAGEHTGRLVQVKDVCPIFDLVVEPKLTTLEDALNRGPIGRVRYQVHMVAAGVCRWRVGIPIDDPGPPEDAAFQFAMGLAWSEAPLTR